MLIATAMNLLIRVMGNYERLLLNMYKAKKIQIWLKGQSMKQCRMLSHRLVHCNAYYTVLNKSKRIIT